MTYPESDSTPRFIPHLSSVSRGPPNLIYDVFAASLKVGFAVDSKLWSMESMISSCMNRESMSLSSFLAISIQQRKVIEVRTFKEQSRAKVDKHRSCHEAYAKRIGHQFINAVAASSVAHIPRLNSLQR